MSVVRKGLEAVAAQLTPSPSLAMLLHVDGGAYELSNEDASVALRSTHATAHAIAGERSRQVHASSNCPPR